MDEHNRQLAELHADIFHALLRGLGAVPAGDLNRDGEEDEADTAIFLQALVDQDPIGDFNNDGHVDEEDTSFLAGFPPATPKHIDRFWWSGGWRWDQNPGQIGPSPWLPLADYPAVPYQDYRSFSNYYTHEDAPDWVGTAIDYNQSYFGQPVVPFFSLTYDGSVELQLGVDPELNWLKARVAAERGCPMICLYALNPPSASWMTPALYRNQFESFRAIVEGCQAGLGP
jgi:hypothetical protein